MRFVHVGLTVRSLDTYKSFLFAMFGFEEVFSSERKEPWIAAQVGYGDAHIKFCHMRGAGLHIELLQYVWPEAHYACYEDTYLPGNVHVAIEVDDLEAIPGKLHEWRANHYEEIGRAKCVGRYSEPHLTEIPDGPNKGARAFYLRGPDGHSFEVIQRPSP